MSNLSWISSEVSPKEAGWYEVTDRSEMNAEFDLFEFRDDDQWYWSDEAYAGCLAWNCLWRPLSGQKLDALDVLRSISQRSREC